MLIKTVTTDRDFIKLREAWDILHKEANGTIFQSFVWNYKWWEIYKQPNYQLRITSYWDNDRLVGLLPFFFEHLDFRILSLNRLRFIGIFETYGEYAPLVHPEFEEQVNDSMKVFCISQLLNGECDKISMFRFSPESDTMQKFMAKVKSKGIISRYAPHCITRIMMPLPDSWDKYLASISSNEKHLIQRRMRALVKEKVVVERLKDEKISSQDFSDFVKLHSIVWEEKGILGYYTSSRFEEFHRVLSTKYQKETQAQLYFFNKDGKRFAAVQVYCMHDTCCFYLSGMDRHHPLGNQSPGKVLLSYAIKDAIEEGYKYFDFQGGDEPYKSRLGGIPSSFAKFEMWKSGSANIKITIFDLFLWLRRVISEIATEKIIRRPVRKLLRTLTLKSRTRT
jgi:CelD/BcsL family acetyltransferase involved in cellulose biosynthesis